MKSIKRAALAKARALGVDRMLIPTVIHDMVVDVKAADEGFFLSYFEGLKLDCWNPDHEGCDCPACGGPND